MLLCASTGELLMKRAVLYLRVSTLDQTTANQERELRQVASRMRCEIVKVYKDHGISGAKGRDKRPAFDALCRDATQRRFDLVMAWSVDRLGRSLQDLIGFLSELHALGIDLFLHQQGLDTTTPSGKAMFQMLGVFAEFERAMIQERVLRGPVLHGGLEGLAIADKLLPPVRRYISRCSAEVETGNASDPLQENRVALQTVVSAMVSKQVVIVGSGMVRI